MSNFCNSKQNVEKKIESELQQAKELAEQATLASMIPEIRTPLNGVIGVTDLFLKTNTDTTQQHYLSLVNQSANSLLDIINDILDFSKIEAGKLELAIEKTDLLTVGSQVADMIKLHAHQKNLEILLNISPDVPRFIWVDPIRLRQILINLLSNAVKFTQQGEIELKVERVGTSDSQLKRLIKPVKAEQLYDALALVKVQKGVETIVKKSPVNPVKPSLSLKSVTILIAEDNPVNMLLATTLIGQRLPNAQLLKAVDGLQALETFQTSQPDLVFMDIRMPQMNGYEATKAIRRLEDGKKTPIIALTAGTLQGEREKCLRLGMDDYLSKPILPNLLEKIINKWLDPGNNSPADQAVIAAKNHFDADALLASMNNDQRLVELLLTAANGYVVAFSERLRQTQRSGNLKELKGLAHQLKGTALTVNFTRLADLANQLENVSETNPNLISYLCTTLETEINYITGLLKS